VDHKAAYWMEERDRLASRVQELECLRAKETEDYAAASAHLKRERDAALARIAEFEAALAARPHAYLADLQRVEASLDRANVRILELEAAASVPAVVSAPTREVMVTITGLQAEVERLRAAATDLVAEFDFQASRFYEAMGDDNPRLEAVAAKVAKLGAMLPTPAALQPAPAQAETPCEDCDGLGRSLAVVGAECWGCGGTGKQPAPGPKEAP